MRKMIYEPTFIDNNNLYKIIPNYKAFESNNHLNLIDLYDTLNDLEMFFYINDSLHTLMEPKKKISIDTYIKHTDQITHILKHFIKELKKTIDKELKNKKSTI